MSQYASVWDALEDAPEAAENMKLRSVFMLAIKQHLASLPGTQTEKAARLGLTQPRLNDLLQGRINKFSLDALVNIAVRAGLHAEVNLSQVS
jgi:predicted XRE-type DNA-binding protein